MSEQKPTSAQETTPIPWFPVDEGVCEIYSNFLHMNWTLYDVRVRFGQIVPRPAPGQPPPTEGWAVNEFAAVTMPWGQAKLLRDMLNQAVVKYEAVNGEITVPTLPL